MTDWFLIRDEPRIRNHGHRPLDLGRIATDLGAALVEGVVLPLFSSSTVPPVFHMSA